MTRIEVLTRLEELGIGYDPTEHITTNTEISVPDPDTGNDITITKTNKRDYVLLNINNYIKSLVNEFKPEFEYNPDVINDNKSKVDKTDGFISEKMIESKNKELLAHWLEGFGEDIHKEYLNLIGIENLTLEAFKHVYNLDYGKTYLLERIDFILDNKGEESIKKLIHLLHSQIKDDSRGLDVNTHPQTYAKVTVGFRDTYSLTLKNTEFFIIEDNVTGEKDCGVVTPVFIKHYNQICNHETKWENIHKLGSIEVK